MHRTIRTLLDNRYKVGAIVCLLVSFVVLGTTSTRAQIQGAEWSQPYRLSTADSISSKGYLVADTYGLVHAFWIETSLVDERSVIQHAQFDGESWSTPVDIHVSDMGTIERLSVTVDQNNTLHLIWTTGVSYRNSPINYTQAPAHDASSAKAWLNPTQISVPAFLTELKVDSNGVLHIVYAKFFEPEAGIYHIYSNDGGENWTEPVWLDPDIPSGYGPFSLEVAVGENNDLHVLWHYVLVSVGNTDWIRYAHSLDGGTSWSTPTTIDKNESEFDVTIRAPGPILTVQGQTVHVIWAAGDLNYRNYRYSSDAGVTWSTPTRIFGNLNGQAGDDLAIDAAGRVHFIGQIRFPQGIYHGYWEQGNWSDPSLVYLIRSDSDDAIGNRFHAHQLDLAVRAGNQLVATFYDRSDTHPYTLYAIHRTLDDVPPAQVLPTPTPPPTPIPTSTPDLTATPILSEPASTPTVRPTFANTDAPAPPADDINSPIGGILWGVIPALLLVAGTTVFHFWKKH